MVSLRRIIELKDLPTIPLRELGMKEGETDKIIERLKDKYKTYDRLAEALRVDAIKLAKAFLSSNTPLEAVGIYMVMTGRRNLRKEELVGMLLLLEHACSMMKEMEREELEIYF